MNHKFNKVAIIGVGLIGGSIAMGLKKHFGQKITILGSCSTPKRAQLAAEQSIIDTPLKSLKDLPKDVDLIILAAPILTNLKLLKLLKKLTLPHQIIMDVGSTKEIIGREASKLRIINFIGTHPMAGKEMACFEHADPNLFNDKPWVICPTKISKDSEIKKISAMIKILGAKPVVMSTTEHDKNATWASHIPLILSSILVNIPSHKRNWKMIKQIASTGFRDTTRLASHNPSIKKDIIETNQDNLLSALCDVQNEINRVITIVRRNQSKAILSYFNHAKKTRNLWLNTYWV